MDMDEDADQDMESLIFETHAFDRGGEIDYGLIRRGGFGFGPGAEEDEPVESISRGRRDHSSKYLHRGQKMSFIRFPSEYYPSVSVYPSLTPHPHPSHFTNLPPYTSRTASSASSLPLAHNRPASPWSAQPYSTTLRAPIPIRGLLQPALATPVSADASDIEKARAQHGSQCKSIPKLVMSLHPDPITGEKSMWSICGDCGACEKAA
jgi:hypothetical protein